MEEEKEEGGRSRESQSSLELCRLVCHVSYFTDENSEILRFEVTLAEPHH